MKRAGGLSGVSPLPRELDYPVMKGDRWHDLYDMIKFPAEASNKPHDTIKSTSSEPSTKGKLVNILKNQILVTFLSIINVDDWYLSM